MTTPVPDIPYLLFGFWGIGLIVGFASLASRRPECSEFRYWSIRMLLISIFFSPLGFSPPALYLPALLMFFVSIIDGLVWGALLSLVPIAVSWVVLSLAIFGWLRFRSRHESN